MRAKLFTHEWTVDQSAWTLGVNFRKAWDLGAVMPDEITLAVKVTQGAGASTVLLFLPGDTADGSDLPAGGVGPGYRLRGVDGTAATTTVLTGATSFRKEYVIGHGDEKVYPGRFLALQALSTAAPGSSFNLVLTGWAGRRDS